MEIDLWIDPCCPYSKYAWDWFRTLSEEKTINPQYHLISLAILNEHKEGQPDWYRTPWAESLKIVKILCMIVEKTGKSAARSCIDSFMEIWHIDQIRPMDNAIELFLSENSIYDIHEAENPLWEDILRTNTNDSQIGIEVHGGSPVVTIQGKNFFGPRFSSTPNNSLEVLNALQVLAGTQEFFGFSKNP